MNCERDNFIIEIVFVLPIVVSNTADSPRCCGTEELCSSQCGNLPGFTKGKPVPGTHVKEHTPGQSNSKSRQNFPLQISQSYTYSLTTKVIIFKLKLMHLNRGMTCHPGHSCSS